MNKEKIISVDCCATPGLLSVDEAIARILEQANIIDQAENIKVEEALGRILAQPVSSTIDIPGYDNSAMDGYAVRSAEISEGIELPVSQRIPAGSVGTPLQPGSVARIFTGAPVPTGADAVVMQEQCVAHDDKVTVNTTISAGTNVRRAGEDIKQGALVLDAGKKIRPQEMGLLASLGVAEISVFRRLKVAIFFTGDELVVPGTPLADGQIYNSNRYTLTGLLQTLDCEIIDLGIVPDTLEATLTVLQSAAEQADMVITSGGVSVGEEDYVRIALEKLGQLSMWRVAMKPGKPVAFGKVADTLFMGLPGNPVSVFVTCLLFARPLILKSQGATDCQPQPLSVKAGFNWSAGGRQEYLRVKLATETLADGAKQTSAVLYPHQGSGVLSSTSWADGLVEVSIGKDISIGDMISYLPFTAFT